MVDDAVADRRLMDNAMFWVEDVELLVRTVTISGGRKIFGECKKIVLKMTFEPLHVRLGALAAPKLAPGAKKIFRRNDLFEYAHT